VARGFVYRVSPEGIPRRYTALQGLQVTAGLLLIPTIVGMLFGTKFDSWQAGLFMGVVISVCLLLARLATPRNAPGTTEAGAITRSPEALSPPPLLARGANDPTLHFLARLHLMNDALWKRVGQERGGVTDRDPIGLATAWSRKRAWDACVARGRAAGRAGLLRDLTTAVDQLVKDAVVPVEHYDAVLDAVFALACHDLITAEQFRVLYASVRPVVPADPLFPT
jgi:hypothetical protein